MTTIDVPDWETFRDRLFDFSAMDREKRNQWWFRGQGNGSYSLEPTIDRNIKYRSDAEREGKIEALQNEFRREVIALGEGSNIPLNDQFELLARHHGLPSPYLDWTRTPWIASFFAFSTTDPKNNSHVAIYALHRPSINDDVLTGASVALPAEIEIVDDPERVSANPRAIKQRGIFIRLSTHARTMEDLLDISLTKFLIPAKNKDLALQDLDQMLLNPTMLLGDLDAAAVTAAWRLS